MTSFNINNFQSQACKEDLGLELGLANKYSVSKGNDIEISMKKSKMLILVKMNI